MNSLWISDNYLTMHCSRILEIVSVSMTLDTVGMSEFSVWFMSDNEHARCIVDHVDIKNRDILIDKMRSPQKWNQMRIALSKIGIELRRLFLYWAYPNMFTAEFISYMAPVEGVSIQLLEQPLPPLLSNPPLDRVRRDKGFSSRSRSRSNWTIPVPVPNPFPNGKTRPGPVKTRFLLICQRYFSNRC